LPDGIFKPKIPIWVYFWRVLQWKHEILYGELLYFTAIWYICWLFGIFSPFGILYQYKNLATLWGTPLSKKKAVILGMYRYSN
jgi:hypothetical protein